MGVGHLAGGESLECQLHLVGGDAAAVVSHADVIDAAGGDLDRDLSGAGIQRVLDQLLDHRDGALDDLACGDLGGDIGAQQTYRHGVRL